MKRSVCLIMALFFLLGVLSVSAFAHTEENPFTSVLYAGKDIPVGEVQVWNDADSLYVKYVLEEEWCLTEYHLDVAAALADIPQTKKGNPKPGKFAYKGEYDSCVVAPEVIVIALDTAADGSLYIAAHAVVYKFETAWQIGDVEVSECEADGEFLLTNYANEFNWKEEDSPGDFSLPVDDCELGPSLAANEPAFTSPFVVGVSSAEDEFPYNSNFARGYAASFDVQWDGSLPLGGRLTISWSPGASGLETKVVSGDGIEETTFTALGANTPGEGWFDDTYPLVENSLLVDPLLEDTHSITFEQTAGNGTFWDWLRLERPADKETAWAYGEQFNEGRNWATYFTYVVQE
jgi:hypothetical protein